jgi:predicted 2-oxoglutarate/Fe(II)-dependent dioxygenase YbiX
VGTVVFAYPGTSAHEVEFVTRGGATVAVLTLDATDLRPLGPDEIHHVRPVTER